MRLLSIISTFAFVFLLTTNAVSATSHTYIDVPATHSNYEDITYLLERNIIVERTTYGINDIVTREEVAVMIAKALQLNSTPSATKFSDVPKSHPNSGYIQSAVEAGIIKGYDNGTFKPNGKITRGHMATFIARAFDLPTGSQIFKDVPKGHTAYEAVQQLAAAGITTGYEDGRFKPAQNLSRAHISAFLTRALVYHEVNNFNVQAFLQTVYSDESVEQQLTLLNEQHKQANALLEKENSSLNTLLTQKNKLEATITATKDKLNPIQAKVVEYHATISSSNAEIQQYRANNKHLVYGTAKQKEQYLQTLEALQTTYTAVQQEKEKALAARDQLNAQYNELKESLNQLRAAIQTKQQAVNKQKETIRTLKAASNTVNTKLAALEQQKQQKQKELLVTEKQTTVIHQTQTPIQSNRQEQSPNVSDKSNQQKPAAPAKTEDESINTYTENTNSTTTTREHKNHEDEVTNPTRSYSNSENSIATTTPEQPEEQPYDIYLDYLTDDEKELARLVNEYRVSLGLEPFTISRSLTIVARTHVIDSNLYEPKNGVDERGVACNGHSWSNNGNWTPVCYTSDHYYAKGMWDKPRELTDYPGNGYEISVWTSGEMSPANALAWWQGSPGHNNVIIGDGSWASLTTMGIGIHEGYSHIWFGKESDPAAPIE